MTLFKQTLIATVILPFMCTASLSDESTIRQCFKDAVEAAYEKSLALVFIEHLNDAWIYQSAARRKWDVDWKDLTKTQQQIIIDEFESQLSTLIRNGSFDNVFLPSAKITKLRSFELNIAGIHEIYLLDGKYRSLKMGELPFQMLVLQDCSIASFSVAGLIGF